ncbi:autophagy-related protein 17 [Tieghemostelium lacteum]|uniref:Autophagy-related protein 17 n=1 Tax=Tieghemostelium lacteum TaxID=361077 RepID=A0A152A2B6_TIELA|nr:autophagy-related protein 17 [Tieghemostelium lacteum]|eukprot:KYR00350.1 autophagy-related protein 17 [Tieghemostelium lacteum]
MNLKKSIEICQTYCTQSDVIVKQSKQHFDKINASISKLQLILKEIEKQINIIKESSKRFNDQLQPYLYQIHSFTLDKNRIFTSIEFKFDILKNKYIDKSFLSTNNNNNNNNNNNIDSSNNTLFKESTPKTLYDFIDVETLDSIKSQFISELSMLNNKKDQCDSDHLASIKNIEELYSNQFMDLVMKFQEKRTKLKPMQDLIQKEREELKQIQNYQLSITSLYDLEVFNQQQYPSQQQQQQVYSVDQQHRIQQQITMGYESMQKIIRFNKEILEEFKSHSIVYEECLGFWSKLNDFFIQFKDIWEQFERQISTMDQHCTAAGYFISELISLDKWYDLFSTSYDQLLEESTRRHKEFNRQKTIAESYENDLHTMYNNEIQQRNRFYESYGKYLPISLFSVISNPPVQFQLKQFISNNSPTVSNSTTGGGGDDNTNISINSSPK